MKYPRILLRIPNIWFSAKPPKTKSNKFQKEAKNIPKVSNIPLQKAPIAVKIQEKDIPIPKKSTSSLLFYLKNYYGTFSLAGLSVLAYKLVLSGKLTIGFVLNVLVLGLHAPRLLSLFGFQFMHASLEHLISTVILVISSGLVLEPKIGAKSLVKIYYLGSLAGMVSAYMVFFGIGDYSETFSCGGSSGSLALIGYATTMTLKHPSFKGSYKRAFRLFFIFSFFLNLIPILFGKEVYSSSTHLTGLVFGAAFAYYRFSKGKI